MNKGSIRSYADNPQKNNAREWKWKRIADRIVDRANALILYLAGSEDLDRREAIKRGFSPNNLIAIEISKASVDILRSRKVITIPGKLHEIVPEWPPSMPIAAIVADFCSGLSKDTRRFALSLMYAPAVRRGTVLAVSCQRGRDIPATFNWDESLLEVGNTIKHRGFQFIRTANVLWAITLGEQLKMLPPADLDPILKWVVEGEGQIEFNEYQSNARRDGGLYFDTVIMQYPFLAIDCVRRKDKRKDHIRSRISAALAIRTTRMKGEHSNAKLSR